MGFWLIGILLSVVGMLVSSRLKSKFRKYSQIGTSSGLSGAQIAAQMLNHYGIGDVKIVEGKGFLSDHYNPMTKTVSLSPEVFRGRSIAAAAVAAHECGHAVQHATAYAMHQFRSKRVPVVKAARICSRMLAIRHAPRRRSLGYAST